MQDLQPEVSQFTLVVAGLVAAIPMRDAPLCQAERDGRNKLAAGFDRGAGQDKRPVSD